MCARPRRRDVCTAQSLLSGAAALCGLSLSLLAAQPAQAYHDWTPLAAHYSMDSACASPVDPIGLVFFGDRITGQNQQEMIQYHTGWGPGGSAGSQYTQRDGPSCDAMVADNSSSCGSCDRFHVRLNYVGSPRYSATAAGVPVSVWDSVVVGTPHQEVWSNDCKAGLLGLIGTGGHRTISYSAGRDAVTYAMASQHPWERVWYGNDLPMMQCGGGTPSYAAGDGVVNYIFSWPIDQPPNPCFRGGVC